MAVTGPFESIVSFIGLSTDTKPTIGVPVGSRFYETDTGKRFIYSGTAWAQE